MKELKIALRNLRFMARHGVMAQERTVGNEFEVDVEISYPFSDSIFSDNLENTVNYAEMHEIVSEEMKTPRNLLETVVAVIMRRIIARWPSVTSGTIKIRKSTPPIEGTTGSAEVTLNF